MKDNNILVYGGCILDNLFSLPDKPVEGGVLYASSYAMSCGGKGANQAVMASFILENDIVEKKSQIFFCSQIGDDIFGSVFQKQFDKLNNINQKFLVVKPDYETALASIYVNEQTQKNSIVAYYDLRTELDNLFKTEKFQESLRNEISVLLLQMEFSEESSLTLMKQFRKISDEKFIILNAAPIRKNVAFHSFVQLSQMIIFNEIEFVSYCMDEGSTDIVEWENLLKEKKFENLQIIFEKFSKKIISPFPGRKIIIVTLGEDGILLFDQLNGLNKYISLCREELESIKFVPVDSTGAGDAFVGSLTSLVLLLNFHKSFFQTNVEKENQQMLIKIVETASLIASSTVKRLGTQVSYLPYNQMEEGVINKIKTNFK